MSESKESTSIEFGIVFDIDGVLMKDGEVIPTANQALNMLLDETTKKPKIPFVFVTNNGGFSESEKAIKISKVLSFPVDEESVMVSHTPVKSLVEKYKDENILLISRTHETSVKLANVYGFHHYITFQDYMQSRPFLCPGKYSTFWTTGVKSDYILKPTQSNEKPIKSIILLEEPTDWGECIQVVCDILQSTDGLLSMNSMNKSETQVIDLHISNPDFTYAGEFVMPRYTMGALRECIAHLYKLSTGNDLKCTLYGKPQEITYQYAKELMSNQVKKLGLSDQSKPKRVYAIGDNPYSDIKGANNLEHEGWVSILVRTGCFQGADNHPEIPAKHVCNDVLDAIKLILSLESNNNKN